MSTMSEWDAGAGARVIRSGDRFVAVGRSGAQRGGFGCADDAMIWMYRRYIQDRAAIDAADPRGDAEEAEYRRREEVTAMSNQTATGQYAIRCFGWFTPGVADVEGYNAWDYLTTLTEHSRFDSAEAAEAALKAEYKGADRDGVEPVLAVVEVADEDA